MDVRVWLLKRLIGKNSGVNVMRQVNNNLAIYPTDNIDAYAQRYITTDDIYSIIKRLATTAALIPLYPYLVKNDVEHKKLLKIRQPHFKQLAYEDLIIKALEDLPETDPVFALLENPSEGISKFEFYEAIYTFIFACGEAFILKDRPTLGRSAGLPTELKVLYPQNVILKVTDTLPRKVVAYDYRVNGVLIYENIPAADVIHIKYFNPSMDFNGNELRGLSPIKVLAKRLTGMDANIDAEVATIQNRGVRKIIADENIPMDAEGQQFIDKRKAGFYSHNSNSHNTGGVYWAGGKLSAIDIGLNTVDLQLLESAKISFKKFCNAYCVSDRLFNNDATGSEVSDDNAHKALYTNATLPTVYRVRDSLKMGVLTEYEKGADYIDIDGQSQRVKGDGVKRDLQADISEIPELQADMQKLATSFAALPAVRPNDVMRALKLEESKDPNAEEVFVKTGYQLLEDFSIPQPLPNDGGQGN